MRNTNSATGFDRTALLLAGLAVLGFSGTMPATRLAVRELDPWFVALARAVVAGSLAGSWLLLRRAALPEPRQLLGLAVVALGTVMGFPILSACALTSVPASDAAMVLAFIPTLTTLAGMWRNGERPAPVFWLANALGLCAVLGFLYSGPQALCAGHALLLAASVVCALGYTEGARLARSMTGLRVVSWSLVLSLPLLVPALCLFLPVSRSVHTASWLGLAYVSLISMFLAFAPWYAALARGGIAFTSQIQLLQPLLSVCWAAWLLGEPVSTRLWLTLGIVLGSIVWARRALTRSALPSASTRAVPSVIPAPSPLSR
ncbi:MAG TPA: DMT family transporter [Polyangiaceae bacterium]|nr:DMT family transporter [Polyangiaceae bacterium]